MVSKVVMTPSFWNCLNRRNGRGMMCDMLCDMLSRSVKICQDYQGKQHETAPHLDAGKLLGCEFSIAVCRRLLTLLVFSCLM